MTIQAGFRGLVRGTALAQRGPNLGLRGRANAARRFVDGGNYWMATRAASLQGPGGHPAAAFFIHVPAIPVPREQTMTTRSVSSITAPTISLKELCKFGVAENDDDG
jgi:hypothetical protein